MQKDLNNAIQKVESQIKEIIKLDTKLLTLHQDFPRMNNDEKELAVIQYRTLLVERNELIDPILTIQEYLNNVVKDLENVKFGTVDRLSHWLKLRTMKKSVSKLIDFVDDEEVSIEEDKMLETAITETEEEKLQREKIFAEIKNSKGSK
jgi:hypothetical protein